MSLATHNSEEMSGQGSEHTASENADTPARRGILFRLSAAIATGESVAAGLAAATTFSLLVVNIVTRSLGNAVYWTDEAAILAMVWMAFLAASLTIHFRSHIAVTLLTDMLRPRVRLVFAVLVDAIMLTLMIVIGILVWNWFDPVGLYRANWDIAAFASTTFNFIYAEPTEIADRGEGLGGAEAEVPVTGVQIDIEDTDLEVEETFNEDRSME